MAVAMQLVVVASFAFFVYFSAAFGFSLSIVAETSLPLTTSVPDALSMAEGINADSAVTQTQCCPGPQ